MRALLFCQRATELCYLEVLCAGAVQLAAVEWRKAEKAGVKSEVHASLGWPTWASRVARVRRRIRSSPCLSRRAPARKHRGL